MPKQRGKSPALQRYERGTRRLGSLDAVSGVIEKDTIDKGLGRHIGGKAGSAVSTRNAKAAQRRWKK